MSSSATVEWSRNPCSSASKVNHSLTNPAEGGSAARVSTATPNPTAVLGIFGARPPSGCRSRLPWRGDAVSSDQRQCLGDRVHDQLKGCCEQSDCGELWLVDGLAEQRDAEAEQDDAALLDAREAEDARDFVLGNGIEDARQGGEPPEDTSTTHPTSSATGPRVAKDEAARGRSSRR